MNTELEQITAKHGAKRYAEAIATAAGAEEKIAALTEAVSDAEYYRSLAESQLNAAVWPEGIGQVIHVGTEPPAEEVYALLDLYSGQAYTRRMVNGHPVANEWVRAESTGWATTYTWPISDAGPFIKLKDNWFLDSLVRDLKLRNEQADRIGHAFYHKDGFREAGSSAYTVVDTADGVLRVVAELERKHMELVAANRELERKLHMAHAALELRREADEAKEGVLA